MKKQSVKKPRTSAKKKAAGYRLFRKRKRKKLNRGDKVRAALVAAVLILAVTVSFLTVMYLHSIKVRIGTEAPVEVQAPVSEPGVTETQTEDQGSIGQTSVGQRSVDVASGVPVVKASPTVKPPSVTAPPVRPAPLASASPPENRPAEDRLVEKRPVENRPLPAVSPGGIKERPSPDRSGVVRRGTLVFVIDDAGYNLRDLEPFLKINGPLTIAVLPGLPYSAEAARRIRAAGKEVFLHQPMEALGGQNPGPGAIRPGMSSGEIRSIISRNLDELWPVAGINNHEGSRVTMDEDAMETVLTLCRERGILFLDSRTTAETAVPRTARKLGMAIGERDVFVDNNQERESMIRYIKTGLLKAEQKGSAIMIGHVWSPGLAPLLAELFPDLKERGYSFSSASQVIGGAKL